MTSASKLLGGAAGAAGGGPLTVDQVFSTYLYTGNGGNQTINNGIDLSGEGGMVWLKSRSNSGYEHEISDTERGVTSNGRSLNSNDNQPNQLGDLTSFNSNGFGLGHNTVNGNGSGQNMVAWSFRKAPKFFDCISFVGNDVAGRQISHSLDSEVGMIAVKNLSRASDWAVFHRSSNSAPQDYVLEFQNANAAFSASSRWNDTAPTSSVFTVGDYVSVNQNGDSYVAYLFADNSSEDAADQMIRCGSFAEASSGNTTTVDLGFEPQWLMVKSATNGDNWHIIDSMRGFTSNSSSNSRGLNANSSSAEGGGTYVQPTSTGFIAHPWAGGGGGTIIYMAIRRDDQSEVTDATDVFAMDAFNGRTSGSWFRSGFPVDFAIRSRPNNADEINTFTRLLGDKILRTDSTSAEASNSNAQWDWMDGYADAVNNTSFMSHMWKRAKSYFDVVCWDGNSSNNRALAHALGVQPEMVWCKVRSSNQDGWEITTPTLMASGSSTCGLQFTTGAAQNRASFDGVSAFTSTHFYVSNNNSINGSGSTYVAYLFATLAGVSKVGSATHSGTTNVDAGFSNGSRFVLLKRTDASGDWLTYDSTRGTVSGNDPYLALNSAAAQVTNTDYIDPYSAGFTLTSSLTAGTYIYYAVA